MALNENQSHKLMGLYAIMLQKELKKFISETIKTEIQNELKQVKLTNELLTVEEVCKIYRVSKSSIERYVRDGLKFSSTAKGCKRLFKKTDVENYKRIKNGR